MTAVKPFFPGMVWVALALMAGAACGSWAAWPHAMPRSVLEQARAEADAADWLGARRILERWLAQHPDDAEALLLMSRVLAGQEENESSLACLKQIATGSRFGAEARLREGQLAWQMRLASKAEASWRACIAAEPLSWQAAAARLDLLQAFEFQGRREEAEQSLWDLYRTHSSPWKLLTRFMQVKLEEVDARMAREVLERCLEQDPTDYNVRRAMGRIQTFVGETQEARSKLEVCVNERPTDFMAWENLCFALYQDGELAVLRQGLERLPSGWERRAELWKYRGVVLEDDGDDAGAAECYNRAVELDSYVPDYQYRLSRTLKRIGQLHESEQHWSRYNELKEDQLNLNKLAHELTDLALQGTGDPEPAMCRDMASGCRTLAWSDLADAWEREAVRLLYVPKPPPTPSRKPTGLFGPNRTQRSLAP